MIQEKYNVIGVMSGTSLDGIDLAHLNFEIINGKWKFQILESETIGYSKDWINQLKIAVGFSESELLELNKKYTLLL
jgi:anhydro-N-acetylmuramic acid kinase